MQKQKNVSDGYPFNAKSENSACCGELSKTVVLDVGLAETGNYITSQKTAFIGYCDDYKMEDNKL